MSIVPLPLSRILSAIAAVFLSVGSVCAQTTTLFEWTGNYVTVDTPLPISSVSTGETSGTYYATANYSTTALAVGGAPPVYGVFTVYSFQPSATLSHFAGYRLSKGSPLNRFYLVPDITDSNLGTTQTVNLLYFRKEDFINGGSSATITLGEGSKLQLQGTSSVGISGQRYTRAAVYALVNGEWGWYLSASSFAGSADYIYDLSPPNGLPTP